LAFVCVFAVAAAAAGAIGVAGIARRRRESRAPSPGERTPAVCQWSCTAQEPCTASKWKIGCSKAACLELYRLRATVHRLTEHYGGDMVMQSCAGFDTCPHPECHPVSIGRFILPPTRGKSAPGKSAIANIWPHEADDNADHNDDPIEVIKRQKKRSAFAPPLHSATPVFFGPCSLTRIRAMSSCGWYRLLSLFLGARCSERRQLNSQYVCM